MDASQQGTLLTMDTITLADGTLVESAPFEFGFTLDGKATAEAQDDGSVLIEGYASDFGMDRQDEAFEPGAFEEGLKAYMDNPILLYHHKPDTALGKILNAHVDNNGLYVKAMVDAPEPGTHIADYVRKIKNGVIKGFSVGGRFYRRMTAAGPRIFKCDLREISVTPLPVNQRMLFAVAGKAFEVTDEMETKTPDTSAETARLEATLARLDAMFTSAERAATEGKAALSDMSDAALTGGLEGKAQHPDGPKIAALLYHVVKVHTLAENTKQNTDDPEIAKVADDAMKSAKKAHAALHMVSAKIGPSADSYGGTTL